MMLLSLEEVIDGRGEFSGGTENAAEKEVEVAIEDEGGGSENEVRDLKGGRRVAKSLR
jgi:hypothetical protein